MKESAYAFSGVHFVYITGLTMVSLMEIHMSIAVRCALRKKPYFIKRSYHSGLIQPGTISPM